MTNINIRFLFSQDKIANVGVCSTQKSQDHHHSFHPYHHQLQAQYWLRLQDLMWSHVIQECTMSVRPNHQLRMMVQYQLPTWLHSCSKLTLATTLRCINNFAAQAVMMYSNQMTPKECYQSIILLTHTHTHDANRWPWRMQHWIWVTLLAVMPTFHMQL